VTTSPLVSVVVPTHNRLSLLRRAMSCILDQKGVDLELIVVDDASRDATPAWLAAVSDPRVRVIRHDPGRYLAASRNSGLDAAVGVWIAFCDDDDMWAPNKLRMELDALDQLPGAEWAACAAVWVDTDLRVIRAIETPDEGDVSALTLAYNPIPGGGSGAMARTDAVREVGGFDTRLKWGEDWDLWTRLSLRSPLAVVNRPLMAYAIHETNMSAHTPRFNRDVALIDAKYANDRRERKVRLNRALLEGAQADLELRAGRRWSAAWHFLGQVARGGGPRFVTHATASALKPELVSRRRVARYRDSVPPGWIGEAERWLTPLRQHSPAPSARGNSDTAPSVTP